MLTLWSALALAGPMVETSPEAIEHGYHAGLVLLVSILLFTSPLFITILIKRVRMLRRARHMADDDLEQP